VKATQSAAFAGLSAAVTGQSALWGRFSGGIELIEEGLKADCQQDTWAMALLVRHFAGQETDQDRDAHLDPSARSIPTAG